MSLGGLVTFPMRIAEYSNSGAVSTNTEAFRFTRMSWLPLCKDGELVTTREVPGRSDNKSGEDDDDPWRTNNEWKSVIDQPWSGDDQPKSADNKPTRASNHPGSANVNASSTDEKSGSTGDKHGSANHNPGSVHDNPESINDNSWRAGDEPRSSLNYHKADWEKHLL